MNSKFTVFEYLYRDASNYKSWGEILLSGECRTHHSMELQEFLEDGLFFIPEKFGLPALQEVLYAYSNGPTEDDHDFHEFVTIRTANLDDIATLELWGSFDSLFQAFSR